MPEKKAKVPRQKMPEQEPQARKRNFNEVPFGYTRELAMIEAKRCLQCKKPLCTQGCPVEVNIPAFIALVAEGKFAEGARKIKETNSLPAVCGRVCPQEEQCEKTCILGKKDQPVAVGRLERFVADFERMEAGFTKPEIARPTGKRIAVVGSGPAGLTCAGDLIKLGHEIHIFEALHKPGGVLVYGIPEFRLPKAILQTEVDYLTSLGVTLHSSFVVGKTMTIDDLFKNRFDAVFVGSGAGAPNFMFIPGENLLGVYSANEYLTRSNLLKAYLFPQYKTPIIRGKNVATIGGGNVAMDSARTALRLGADNS
ncbi:MAG: NAD(P)-dependent oxidoreductase, partial [Planctomycetota bacterium]|nr:NAD(P)-dependent oxidoreductase [Planctomycetota bacterium]